MHYAGRIRNHGRSKSGKYLSLALFGITVTGAYFLAGLFPGKAVTEGQCLESRESIIRSINDYRQDNGLEILQENRLMTAAAQSRAIYDGAPERDSSYFLNNMGVDDVTGIVSASVTNYSYLSNRLMKQLKADSNEFLLNSQFEEIGSGAFFNDKGCYQVMFLR